MTMTTLICPSCRSSLHADRTVPAGVLLTCPGCGDDFVSPDAPPALTVKRPWMSLGVVAALVLAVAGGAGIVFAALAFVPPRPVSVAETADDDKDADAPADDALEKQREALARERLALDVSRALAKADAAALGKKYADAEALYEKVLALDPLNDDAAKGLVSAQAALAAEKQVSDEAAKRNKEADRLFAEGNAARKARRLEQAAQLYESARQLDATRKDVNDALVEVRTALDLDATEAARVAEFRKHAEAGKAALAAERYADAVREYTAALAIEPADAASKENLAAAEKRLAAVADAKKRQDALDNLVTKGRQAGAARRYNEAVATLEAALRVAPEDREAKRLLLAAKDGIRKAKAANANLMARADEAAKAGNVREAKKLADEAVANWPEDRQAEAARRELDRRGGDALTVAGDVIRLARAGALALAEGRNLDAVTALTEARRLAPADLEIAQSLLLAQSRLEADARVRIDATQQVRMGTAALNRGSFTDAIGFFNQALAAAPGDPNAADGLSRARYGQAMKEGIAAMRANNTNLAAQRFAVALSEKPGDPQATFGLRTARGRR